MDILLMVEIASLCVEFLIDVTMITVLFIGIVYTGLEIAKKYGHIHDSRD